MIIFVLVAVSCVTLRWVPTVGGMVVSCRFWSTFLSSYNYSWYELCRLDNHCTSN